MNNNLINTKYLKNMKYKKKIKQITIINKYKIQINFLINNLIIKFLNFR